MAYRTKGCFRVDEDAEFSVYSVEGHPTLVTLTVTDSGTNNVAITLSVTELQALSHFLSCVSRFPKPYIGDEV